MRHDPARGAIVIMLRSLKIHGMAQAITERMERALVRHWSRDNGERSPAFEAAVPVLSPLIKAELAEREVRSIA